MPVSQFYREDRLHLRGKINDYARVAISCSICFFETERLKYYSAYSSMTIYPIADSRLADHNFIFIYVLKNIVFARGEDSN